jgi:hypothetical protein
MVGITYPFPLHSQQAHNFGLVIATCKELDIAVIAYSYALHLSPLTPLFTLDRPLGRGLLTGRIRGLQDLQAGDHRKPFARFQDEVGTVAHLFSNPTADTIILQRTSAITSNS